MLTTTLDGLWVLQVLAGVEVVAPELGLRPHLPSTETATAALAHPVAQELRAAGVISAAGEVDRAVLEWLTVLSRRDVALVLYAQTPNAQSVPERVLLARFARWWVALERHGDLIRLSGVGTATSESAAARLVSSEIERLCGRLHPASLRPVTLDVDQLLDRVGDRESLRHFLRGQRLDSDQVAALMLASDVERSAQASIVATQAGVSGAPARSHVESGTVTIMDTPAGRMVAEHLSAGGKRWMVVGPGTVGNVTSAVLTMTRRLPSRSDWHCYRKVV